MAWEYIELNICPTGDKPVFHAAQYDIGRPIIIKLKNGEDDFTPTDLDIELQVRKVDNNVVTAVPDSVDGNVVTFLTTEQMTACSGTNLCEVQLTTGDNTMATLHFYLVVQRDALQGGLSSQSEIHDLEDQIAALVPEVIGDKYYTADEVDEKIAEIPTFDPSNYYDKTQLYTKTETNGLLAQKANTSALATVAFTGSYDDLVDHPVIPDVSDYYTKEETYSQNEVNTLLGAKADTSSLAAVATSGDYDDLTNKPTIPAAQVNSDWNASSGVAQILNKPTVYQNAAALPISANDSTDTKTYIDTGLAIIGAITTGTISGSVSCPNETITEIGSITLNKGVYVLVACCDWGSNSSGYRQVGVSTNINGARNDISTTMACNGTNKETYVQFIKVLNIETDNTTTKVYGAQNSGSTLSAFPYIYAVRLA